MKLVASLLVLLPTLLFAQNTVLYSPGPHKPGSTLAVEVPAKQKKAPILLWGEQEIPFYKKPFGGWRALVRVPLDESAGDSSLAVRTFLGRSSKFIDIPFSVRIASTSFGSEVIRFSKEKKALLNDPSEDRESRLIREALAKADQDKKQYWKGTFIKPIPGVLLSPFGIKRDKVGQVKPDIHRGVDFRGPRGEPIKAPNDGRVLLTEDFKFHGKTVVLSHGQGVTSIYIHMDKIQVQTGQKVRKGGVLGTVGSTGLATAPHLHWGIYVHVKAVEPLQWLDVEF